MVLMNCPTICRLVNLGNHSIGITLLPGGPYIHICTIVVVSTVLHILKLISFNPIIVSCVPGCHGGGKKYSAEHLKQIGLQKQSKSSF